MSQPPARRERSAPPAQPKVIEYPGAPSHDVPGGEGYATFVELAGLLWRHKGLIIAVALLGGAAGVIAAFAQTRIYQARTSFEIRMPNEDYLNRRQFDPNVESGIILMEPFLQTQIKLLQSDTLLLQVAGKLGLAGAEEFRGRPSLLSRLFPASEATPASAREGLLAAIRKRLSIRLANQTQVVEVLFESRDPRVAARFANEMAESYQTQSLQRRIQATIQTGTLLSRQIEGLEGALRSAERELQDFVTSSGLLAGPERDSVEEARLRQLQNMLTAATDARVAEQSRYEQAQGTAPESMADVLDSESLRTYRARMTDLRQKLAEANQIYKPMHFRVRQIQAELLEVEQALAREREGVLSRHRQSYLAAEHRERALRKDYDAQVSIAARQSARSVRYATLKNNVETQRQIYDATLRRVKDAEVASAMQASNVLVIDPAVVPEKAIKPNKPFYLVLGSAAGVFLGVVLAFAKDRRGVPVDLDMAPELAAAPSRPLGRPIPVVPLPISKPEPEHEDAEAEPPDTAQPAVGTFRGMVSCLTTGTDGNGPPGMVVLTSVCGDEDRTAVACNLAIAVAETGRRVLLIDANRFSPRVHTIMGVPNDFGISELLEAEASGAPVTPGPYILPARVANLHLLPSGRSVHRLPEFLRAHGSPLLDQLRRYFELIVVDAPPVLSGAEVPVLGRLSDGVVMVIRGQWTAPYLWKAAEHQLAAHKVRVIGTIDNA